MGADSEALTATVLTGAKGALSGHPRCVIALGVEGPTPDGHPEVKRAFAPALGQLTDSLRAHGYAGTILQWNRRLPAGCPAHHVVPFAFKPFCFREAAARFSTILWLDASITAVSPLDDLFAAIERDGYLFFAEDHSVGEYCKDDALVTLEISREESFTLRSCWATAIGLDMRTAKARAFLDRWLALAGDGVTFPGPKWSGVKGFPLTASHDARVKGHRHDQTAASVIAWRLGMTNWKDKTTFSRYLVNHRLSTYVREPTDAV